MMPFDDIDRLIIESILASNPSSDLWMCSLDIVIHRFSEVMEESSLEGEYWISPDELGNRFSDIRNLLTMHEDILPIARSESELPDEWDDLFWDTDDSHLVDRLATEIIDELIRILLVFFYDLFDTSWLDTLIEDEVFERLLGDVSSKQVKTRQEHGIRRIIDDERYSCCLLECDDIASFFSDDFPLEVIALQLYHRLCGLSCYFSGILLDALDEDLSSHICFSILEFFFLFLDKCYDIALIAFLRIVHDECLRFFG